MQRAEIDAARERLKQAQRQGERAYIAEWAQIPEPQREVLRAEWEEEARRRERRLSRRVGRRLHKWMVPLWVIGFCVLISFAMTTRDSKGYLSVAGWIAFVIAGGWSLLIFSDRW